MRRRDALLRADRLAHGEAAIRASDRDHALANLQVLGSGFEVVGRPLEKRPLHLHRGHLRGAPAHVRRVARERADVPGNDVGVAVDDRHVLEAHAELFGDDLRERGVRARAEARGAGEELYRAVLVHSHGRVALLLDARIGARAVHLAPHAPAAPHRPLRRPAPPAQLRPSGLGRAAPDAVLEPVADDRMAGRGEVAFAHGVSQLELGRVDAELLRRLVHLDVERVVGLHDAVAAIRAGDRACWCTRSALRDARSRSGRAR